MIALLDSNILTATFRRSKIIPLVREHALQLIARDELGLIGNVRQEALSGVATVEQYKLLQSSLEGLRHIDSRREDHDLAAEYYNRCRWAGVQGANTDFLLAAISSRLSLPIWTLDLDFRNFSPHIPITLYSPPSTPP